MDALPRNKQMVRIGTSNQRLEGQMHDWNNDSQWLKGTKNKC